MMNYREQLIRRITKMPPSICPNVFIDFTLRGEREKIEWNVDMLVDNGIPTNQLRDLCTLLENRAEEKHINIED